MLFVLFNLNLCRAPTTVSVVLDVANEEKEPLLFDEYLHWRSSSMRTLSTEKAHKIKLPFVRVWCRYITHLRPGKMSFKNVFFNTQTTPNTGTPQANKDI